jgi:hypothetical protein
LRPHLAAAPRHFLWDEGLAGNDRVALIREFADEIDDAGLLDEGGW